MVGCQARGDGEPGRGLVVPFRGRESNLVTASGLRCSRSVLLSTGVGPLNLARCLVGGRLLVGRGLLRLLQSGGVFHLRTLPERLLLSQQSTVPLPRVLLGAVEPRLVLPRRGELILGGAQVAARVLVGGIGQPNTGGVPPRGHLRVAAVELEEVLGRLEGVSGIGDASALLLQRAEGLGDIGDHRLVERREGLGQRSGERTLVGSLRELRLAQLDEQVDEGGIPLLAEAEQRLVDRPAVGLLAGVHVAVAGQRIAQSRVSQHGAVLIHQPQVADPTRRGEPPLLDDASTGGRL